MLPDTSIKKPKLIFVWNYIEWGGHQVHMLSIMKVAKADWDITVLLPRKSNQDFLSFLDQYSINYQFLENAIVLSTPRSFLDKIARQAQRIRTEIEVFRKLSAHDLKNSVVHTDHPPWQSWLLILALCLKGANLFATMHNMMPRTSTWRETIWKTRLRIVSRLSRFQLFTSNRDTKDRLKGWVTDGFWDRIKVTYTAVDPTQIEEALTGDFDRAVVRKRNGIREDRFIVLCVGQFVDRKGRWQYLEAAKIIAEKRDDIDLVWMTPQLPEGDDLDRVDRFELGDRFRIVLSADVGKDRQSVLTFFRIADAFALPSLIEGLPIALLEAMALGLPSISTNINAIPEAIFNEETGLLIEPDDAVALANAIERLADSPELRHSIADRGRQLVLSDFDERKIAEDVISAYRSALSRK